MYMKLILYSYILISTERVRECETKSEREREEGGERKLLVCERGVCERVVLECLGCPYLSDLYIVVRYKDN